MPARGVNVGLLLAVNLIMAISINGRLVAADNSSNPARVGKNDCTVVKIQVLTRTHTGWSLVQHLVLTAKEMTNALFQTTLAVMERLVAVHMVVKRSVVVQR